MLQSVDKMETMSVAIQALTLVVIAIFSFWVVLRLSGLGTFLA